MMWRWYRSPAAAPAPAMLAVGKRCTAESYTPAAGVCFRHFGILELRAQHPWIQYSLNSRPGLLSRRSLLSPGLCSRRFGTSSNSENSPPAAGWCSRRSACCAACAGHHGLSSCWPSLFSSLCALTSRLGYPSLSLRASCCWWWEQQQETACARTTSWNGCCGANCALGRH